MKRMLLVCLLCLAFMFSAAQVSQAAMAEDYAFVLNSLPKLGEKVEKLPNFVKYKGDGKYPNDPTKSGGRFEGDYAGLRVFGGTIVGIVYRLEIIPISPNGKEISQETANNIIRMLENMYGPAKPTNGTTTYSHQWDFDGYKLYFNCVSGGKLPLGYLEGNFGYEHGIEIIRNN